jgi:protein arginine kinase activator
MMCQDCGKTEAVVHLTQIVNNKKTTLALCKDCAEKRGFHSPLDNVPFPLAEILSGMAQHLPVTTEEGSKDTTACPRCGLTFQEFTRQGRFGCGDCYGAFRHRLETIMRKIHGASLHRGRTPSQMTGEQGQEETAKVSIREEERLRSELQKAINHEDFERAAEIRDKLKMIQHELAEHNDVK